MSASTYSIAEAEASGNFADSFHHSMQDTIADVNGMLCHEPYQFFSLHRDPRHSIISPSHHHHRSLESRLFRSEDRSRSHLGYHICFSHQLPCSFLCSLPSDNSQPFPSMFCLRDTLSSISLVLCSISTHRHCR